MRRNSVILLLLFSTFVSFQMMAQPGGPSKNAPTPPAQVVVLSQTESFEFLKNLNDKSEKFLLKIYLAEALLEEKALEVLRFAITVNKGIIVLTLQGNSWRIIPTKS